MKKFFILLLISINAQALVVVKTEFSKTIELKIIRAEPDSFGTYALMNHNGREMTLICSFNRVYDNNPLPIIRYRNFYGEEVGDFILESEKVCQEMGKFIEAGSMGIDESRPFLISLNTKSLKVDKIVYPKIDLYTDDGKLEDLLPKKPVYIQEKSLPLKNIMPSKNRNF